MSGPAWKWRKPRCSGTACGHGNPTLPPRLHPCATFAQQMQSDSVDQQDLMRAAKADEDNYLLYLHKREEARIGDALDERRILNVAIVEPPVAPALAVHSLLRLFPARLRTGHGVQRRHRLYVRVF